MENPIMEVREDHMLSPAGDSQPTFRTAHFLKPISNEINLNPSSSFFVSAEPNECISKIPFNGWRYPQTKWFKWVDQLKPKYESVWKKAGIFEAIMSTKSRIMKNQDLIYGVVEKWCCETNTFVFPFGEATITLEDVMVLGGYSLFGVSVFTPLKDEEMKEVEKKLIIAREERMVKGMRPSTSMWIDIFINSKSEIEHEAFLATWLSIFVFPQRYYVVKSCLFPIAVNLARGKPIALAPAVLASLYKDLSLFKETLVGLKECSVGGDKLPSVLEVYVQSPFYLVQVWVWERFKNLQPQPNLINNEDHVLLRWHMVRALEIDNVRLALDSAIDDFLWRPYVRYADKCGMFYPNDEISVPFNADLVDTPMLSFVICMRVSELVGFDSIEQYLPHRVSMQFGMDQDVPGYVARINETIAIAWKNYTRPLSNTSLYFPSRFFEADVTTRYAKWWKKSVLGPQGFYKNVVRQKRSVRSLKFRPTHAAEFPPPKLVGCCSDVPKVLKTMSSENPVEDGLNAEKNVDAPSSLPPKRNNLTPLKSAVEDCKNVLEGVELKDEKSIKDDFKSEKYVDADTTPSLPQNHNTLTPLISVEDSKHVLEDFEFKDANESKEARLSNDGICESGTQYDSYSYLSEVSIAKLEQRISGLEKVHAILKMARKSREGNARPMSGSQ